MNGKRNIKTWILLLDFVWIGVALAVASFLHEGNFGGALFDRTVFLEWAPVLVAALVSWTILYAVVHLDGFQGGWHFANMMSQVSLGVGLMVLLLFAYGFLVQGPYSRLVIISFGAFAFAGFVAIRCGASILLRSPSRRGSLRRTVILGNGNIARELARKISRHPELMCEVVGFLFPNGEMRVGKSGEHADPAAGTSVATVEVVELLRAHKVNDLLIALPDSSPAELKKLVGLCRAANIDISLVPQWYELYVSQAHLVEIDGLPMLSLTEHRPAALDFVLKRGIDIVLGIVCSVLALPVLLVSGAFLLIDKGLPLKVENRCGRQGHVFRMYRFNVDREHREALGIFERVLARFSLTELPQLWNVLRGDMSLVGPRPESPERVQYYSDWQRQRLIVRPGLTGLAQVHGLRDQHASEDKARYDLQYINQWTPFLDLSIILQTCWTLLIRFGSSASLPFNRSIVQEVVVPHLNGTEVQYADRTNSCAD